MRASHLAFCEPSTNSILLASQYSQGLHRAVRNSHRRSCANLAGCGQVLFPSSHFCTRPRDCAVCLQRIDSGEEGPHARPVVVSREVRSRMGGCPALGQTFLRNRKLFQKQKLRYGHERPKVALELGCDRGGARRHSLKSDRYSNAAW